MNEKMVELITNMVSSGGTAALWCYGIYVVGEVAKFIISFGCIYYLLWGIYHFCKVWANKVLDEKH